MLFDLDALWKSTEAWVAPLYYYQQYSAIYIAKLLPYCSQSATEALTLIRDKHLKTLVKSAPRRT